MSLEFAVLRSKAEMEEARRALVAEGLQEEQRDDIVMRAKRRLGVRGTATSLIPDPRKSWDVRRATTAIRERCAPDDPVLDMGSVGSAIPPAVHRLGFRDVHGVDLDPQVTDMAHSDAIDYRVGDMFATPFDDHTFAAITAISVIEHGFRSDALLDEVARLLRPGGFFFFSTDYWPEKIDTGGKELFGMAWRIFSAEEIEEFVAQAAQRGLTPAAPPAAALRDAGERTILYEGFEYTFLAGALIAG
jgi:2-polyprenyl-3-methyl-5-hydroxy-6-metoxy-1,4-benzoquinol methylase